MQVWLFHASTKSQAETKIGNLDTAREHESRFVKMTEFHVEGLARRPFELGVCNCPDVAGADADPAGKAGGWECLDLLSVPRKRGSWK